MESLSNGDAVDESLSTKSKDNLVIHDTDSSSKMTVASLKSNDNDGSTEVEVQKLDSETKLENSESMEVDKPVSKNGNDTKIESTLLDDSKTEQPHDFTNKEVDAIETPSPEKVSGKQNGIVDCANSDSDAEVESESVNTKLETEMSPCLPLTIDNPILTPSEDSVKDISSVNKDITCSKGTIIEIGKTSEEGIGKNHLMSGGSIVGSNDNTNTVKPSLSKSSKINDIAKKLLCENSSKLSNKKASIEITISGGSKQENCPSVEKLKVSSSGVIDLSGNNAPTPEVDPLKKLNEHLKSIGVESKAIPVCNHSPNSGLTAASNSLSSITVTEVTDLQSSCDKENKNHNTTPLQERLRKEGSDSFVFADLSNEETGFPEVFTGLVKIGKYISVKGDFTLRSSEALVESPSLVAPYLLKEPDVFPPKEKDSKSEVKDFFHTAAGEVLIGIGISRVNEWFHRDMARIKKRQMKKGGKTPELQKDLSMHENSYVEAKKANSIYTFDFNTCKTCGFATESAVVMEGHLLMPHVTQRREYKCNFCDTINKDPKLILEHMKNEHRKVGKIQPPVLFFECPYCSFENNSKVKLNNHLVKCQRFFDHGINQAPPKDYEFPALTPKPITVAVVKAYEKSLGSMHRGRGRPKKDVLDQMHSNQFSPNTNLSPLTPTQMPNFRASSNSPLADGLSLQNQIMSTLQMNMNMRPAHSNVVGRPGPGTMHIASPNRFFQVMNTSGQMMSMLGNNPMIPNSQFAFTNLSNAGMGKSNPYFNSMIDSSARPSNSQNTPSVTITPLPKLQGPYPVPMAKPSSAPGISTLQSGGLVVCEICDGYIKDLEQLRTHMQLIHKVKIHPKMLVSRPPLNCQKCQWRFFTDQGLERHLLGAHGLVTSNMTELANKGKDAGCCTICGRVYASKLVNHMNQVHKVTLKPAHLSYKCTVCSATFNLYRLFENHVYLVHSGAAKRSTDGRSSPTKKLKSCSDDTADSEMKSTDKKSSDENSKKCITCGKSTSSQNDECEKCLKSEKSSSVTLKKITLDDELKSDEKALEHAAA